MHEVLVNHLGGVSLPRKSVVRLTDRPDMNLDVYCGHKTTIQPDLGPITCQCNRLQLQLLSKTMITDYNYNYIFLNVIDYNYNYFAK